MSGEELFFEFGNIDERFILNAAPKSRKKIPFRHFLSAVCILLALCVSAWGSVSLYYDIKYLNNGKVVWAGPVDVYVGLTGVGGGVDAGLKWATAMAVEHNGYMMSPELIDAIERAADDDVLAIIVTDDKENMYGDRKSIDIFAKLGIPTVTRGGRLFIFPTKHELYSMHLDDEYREKLVFVLAQKTCFDMS